MERRSFIIAPLVSGAQLMLAAPSRAQTTGGNKTIRIIVPFAPGGSGDITARMLGDFIHEHTGQSVVVENKPGANGIIGVEAAKRAPNDGSTLLLATTSTHLANPNLFRNLPYDPEKDFTLVGHFGTGSMLVLVRPDSRYRTLADLIADARAHPDKLNYGHFNASSNVPGAIIGRLADIRLTPVAYKQIGAAMTDLMGAQIDVVFVDSVAGDKLVTSGQLRAIAAAGLRRLPNHPNVPLVTETLPGYDVSGGFLGVAVPQGAPQAVLQSLNTLINDAISSVPMKPYLEKMGFHPKRMSLAEMAEYVRRERARWKDYVSVAGLQRQ